MKKFLSILLAVMMVLSTVSFAAPSLAGTADSAVETPVVEVAPTDEAAELAASTVDEFGTLLAEIDFNSATLGEIDFGSGLLISALGGSSDIATAKLTNGSGEKYPAMGAVIKERASGDKYLELTTNATAAANLLQLYTGSTSTYFTTEDGYLTVTFDVNYGTSAATGKYHDVCYNRSQAAEARDTTLLTLATENGGWGKVISSFDDEIGMSGIGGDSATMLPNAVNYIKIHGASGVEVGETYGIDNIRVYYRPKTVDVTLYVDGVNDVEIADYDTLGMEMDDLAAMLPAVEGKVLTGFSLEKGGELLATTKFASDCTVYPVYEERVALTGSLEFNDAADFTKFSKRQGSNNALAANFVTHDATNGYLVATFDASNDIMVQDTGLNLSGINFPAGVLTNIEFKVRFTGMPQESGKIGTQNYNPAAVGWPELYYTTGGTFVHGTGFTCDLTGKNGEWLTFNYTAEELGISDLTTFRFDFYNYMPDGSTMEVDYIRFIGRPVRVTVDNGANATAPEVVMDITTATTVAEVEAKFAKDNGDMKFLGLSRTEGGEVLASTELVSAEGAPTTLYAVWEDYEYLTRYSLNFDEVTDVTSKIHIVQNNDGVDGNSTYGTTYFWNEGGYLTLKAVAADGYTATWDHQVYVDTFNAETALPAGVVSEIAVRMRYRNIPAAKATYTITGRSDTAFDPANNAAFVHIGKYGDTAWNQNLQSKNRQETNLVDGEWFTRYLDAATYFAEGLSYVRLDTVYPMPDGAEVDIDYIRFVGDNDNENIPGAEFLGEYGEKVFTVDFDDAEAGELTSGLRLDAIGGDVNSWISKAAASEIGFSFGANGSYTAPTGVIEGTDTDKYFTYTLNAAGSYNYFFLRAFNSSTQFVDQDGYFIATFDYKTSVDKPFTFRFNRQDQIEDAADNIQVIDNGDWKTAVVYYDNEIGSAVRSGKTSIASTDEINIVKWHPTGAGAAAGTTVSIDNFALWFVPKTVEVTVDLSKYGVANAVIEDYPTNGMSKEQLTRALPAVPDREITGLSLTDGGEALYENRIATESTVYPVYEKVKVLDQTLEFNSGADYDRLAAISGGLRLGKNNAKTVAAEQFVITSDDTASYISMENEAADGEGGVVVDYGFIVTQTPFSKEEVKEIVIRLRLKNIPDASAKYTCGDHCTAGHTFNPTDAYYMELVWWDAADETGETLKQQYVNANLTALEGDWFTYTIPAANFPYDNIKQFRFDPFADYAPHGTVCEVDYIRFYGYPEPDAPENVSLAYSAEFNENATGVSLNAWKKEDGTYMFDDGVNGDRGPGIGSKYLTDGAEGYITWNADGYVTLNFDANDEVKAAAAEAGYTAAVYDPSIYVSALDKAKYIPAGAFEELVIRMRIRGLPADGTTVYGQNYGGLNSAEFTMTKYPVYFHWMNSRDAVLYDGVQSKHFDDTCVFTEGSYVADEWFEVTIPASFFEADVEDLATLRINLPDWTPDGTKIDIDYIRFMGQPAEVDAPTSLENETSIRMNKAYDATGEGSNGLRFKATVTSATDTAATELGFVVVSYDKFMAEYDDVNDLTVDLTYAKVGYKRVNGENVVNYFNTDNDEALEMAAVLYGIPEDHFDSDVIVRPFAFVDGAYYYGTAFTTSLYAEALAIFDDPAYEELTYEQQDYIAYVVDTVEL